MDIEALRQEYDGRKERYQRLKDEVEYVLERELNAHQIPFQSIAGRVKSFDSFVSKANRQEHGEPFETVVDICGVRIICLFLSDIARIAKIIESKFAISAKDDKLEAKPEEAFGYLSVHYIGSLPDSFSGPRYDDLKDLKFEIQLRTIAMHAWATISHYLDYKSPHAIPSHLRKDFGALSALFYVADSHFELFFRSSREAKEAAEEKAQHLPDIEKEEINFDTLSAYLRKRYPRREHLGAVDISNLVEELLEAGYTQISQLEVTLQRSEKAFAQYEEDHPPTNTPRYADVGVVRVSLSIADDRYADSRRDELPENGFEEYRQYTHLLS